MHHRGAIKVAQRSSVHPFPFIFLWSRSPPAQEDHKLNDQMFLSYFPLHRSQLKQRVISGGWELRLETLCPAKSPRCTICSKDHFVLHPVPIAMKPLLPQDGDKFIPGPVISTRMMPPPHLQAQIIIILTQILTKNNICDK